MLKFPLLTSEDIEVKVKQITKAGALLLLYKTSRTDAKILDATVGPMNWCDDFREIKGNLYCGIGIREKESDPFIFKWDCGIESGQDDGQEKKAEASDARKRACTVWGVGRELYSSPAIWANVATVEKGGKWVLEDPRAKYIVTDIEYNETTRVITKLEISNAKSGVVVFNWAMPTTEAMTKKMVKTLAAEADTSETETKASTETKKAAKKATETAPVAEVPPISAEEKMPLKELIRGVGLRVKALYANKEIDGPAIYKEIVDAISPGFKCNVATEAQYDTVLAIYNKLEEYNG